MAGGRPNKYDTHIKPYLKQMAILRSHGEEYSSLARMFNIAESTLYKHKSEIEEFSETLKKGDQILIDELEATLYDLAKGRVERKKTKIEYHPDGTIKSREETTEMLAPNVAALIFSLTNLAPEKWRNKSDVSATNEIAKDMEQFNG